MPAINPCPRCKSKMVLKSGGGGMRDFPFISLSCSNKDCWWNMRVTYDELSSTKEEDVQSKLIEQWNEGTQPS